MVSLGAQDVVVLVSQGFNRADSAIVMQAARAKGAKTIVLSAYQGDISADAVIRFTPTAEEERLFCRPCGAITSFIAGAITAARCLRGDVNLQELRSSLNTESQVWRSGKDHRQVAKLLNSASLVIVLGSGSLLPALHNTALALREGAGLVSEFYEIEYYAHGQYAPHYRHQDHGGSVVYLLGEASADPISMRSVERIMPLLEKTGATHEVFRTSGDLVSGMVAHLSVANQLVYGAIVESGYDMNTPRGKEENRGFQLVGASYYE
jgi:fructoselysine-6-P-deglycase FrlB-like protein